MVVGEKNKLMWTNQSFEWELKKMSCFVLAVVIKNSNACMKYSQAEKCIFLHMRVHIQKHESTYSHQSTEIVKVAI